MAHLLADIAVSLILILGISQFRTPRGARIGNLIAALALVCAIVMVLMRHRPVSAAALPGAIAIGLAIGWWLASRVNMIQIPAMVAFQHGMGGVAALLVSYLELTREGNGPLPAMGAVAALLGLLIGAATFSGSMVAAAKLANRIRQTPVVFRSHNLVLAGLCGAVLFLMATAGMVSDATAVRALLVVVIGVSIALGILFSVRIGGADMPVLISFLNAAAGLAASFCGLAIGNRLLIVCGATVAASGSVLTHIMCRAMNRHLIGVFSGRLQANVPGTLTPAAPAEAAKLIVAAKTRVAEEPPAIQAQTIDPLARASAVLRSAQRVIVIPGYGMALAEAQEGVSRLADKLTGMGKEVIFAVHPVAGRMPGHMHVLLAEAEVDYGMIRELKDVNAQFATADLALVVGACDVVNPAAIECPDTPISGMPILHAHEARNVVVCNLDERPGYSGVQNPLYRDPKTILLLGDAKQTIDHLLKQLD